MVAYLHYSKPGAKRGYPWTIHVSKTCIPAKEVVIFAPVVTIYKKNKPTNPKAMLRIVDCEIEEYAKGKFKIMKDLQGYKR